MVHKQHDLLSLGTLAVLNGINRYSALSFFAFLAFIIVTLLYLFDSYKNNLVEEISQIPEENLIDPPMNIVGPALEASKFYIEEEELRKMFAKVVAASMDSRRSTNVHPAFVEIIKQLDTLDAQNIKLFDDLQHDALPIVEYRVYSEDNQISYGVIDRHVFLSNPNCQDIKKKRKLKNCKMSKNTNVIVKSTPE